MSRLAGRVALVTGGLRGIGYAIVERFVEEGALVLATDLDADGGSLPDTHDGRLIYQRLDVTQDADWGLALDLLDHRFGALDILVNNAGSSRTGTIASTSDEDWRFVMDTNAFSVFLGCRHAVARMGERGGAIVNIASARGLRAGSTQCAYSASKAAVLSLTESVALHCGETGLPIRCNAICPGVIETPQMRRHAETNGGDRLIKTMTAMQIMGRLGSAREVADAAVFLASDEANFVTGTALRVDGGFVIRDR
jgi:NAD(P)-dependent dehydrogenase (short-subunit alcohol dehydrogenase family)